MLLTREKSGLILVDVQEKLTPHVLNSTSFVACCEWLLRLAKELQVPIVAAEQYPQGLGHTIEPLRTSIMNEHCISKVHFSCYREPSFVSYWNKINKNQAVIIGIETHVCVLQTAIDMKEAGFDVFVVINAVSSRQETDHRYALKRMKQIGIHLVTMEMVFFEWVRQAGTAEFKALSQAYLR